MYCTFIARSKDYTKFAIITSLHTYYYALQDYPNAIVKPFETFWDAATYMGSNLYDYELYAGSNEIDAHNLRVNYIYTSKV